MEGGREGERERERQGERGGEREREDTFMFTTETEVFSPGRVKTSTDSNTNSFTVYNVYLLAIASKKKIKTKIK